MKTLKTRRELVREWYKRFRLYVPDEPWNFQPLSLLKGLALATASLASGNGYVLYQSLLQRFTVMASADDFLDQVARERGRRRRGPRHARALVIIQPRTAIVTAVDATSTKIEVSDSTDFEATRSLRIRSADGSTSESATISSVTVGTGPNGGDELIVPALTNTYLPTTEVVNVLLRVTLPVGTLIDTLSSTQFKTLEAVTTGDSNAVFNGESTALALADKVRCEATTAGSDANIPVLSVTTLVTPVPGILKLQNPEAGRGGEDAEEDFQLKRRTMQGPAEANQETRRWLETMLRRANEDVERVIEGTSGSVGVMAIQVLNTNGGAFTASEIAAMKVSVEARVRSQLTLDIVNITLTAVEVEAQITLEPNFTLQQVLRAAGDRLAVLQALDYRKADFGVEVDNSGLLAIVRETSGVATLDTTTFLPSAPVPVVSDSLPRLIRLSLKDTVSGETINALVNVSF